MLCLEYYNVWLKRISKQPFLSHEIGFLMNGTPRNEYIKLGFIRICTDIPSISEFPARSSLALSILLRLTRRKSICCRWPMTLPCFANRKKKTNTQFESISLRQGVKNPIKKFPHTVKFQKGLIRLSWNIYGSKQSRNEVK